MKDHGYCHCEGTHRLEQEAVGCIHMIQLDDGALNYDGYKVCPACLGEFLVTICMDRTSDLRLAFRVHELTVPCR